tara:strand:- start:76 stop:558 length:483 start_codon:yes stop_codon:yes gene_type:complete
MDDSRLISSDVATLLQDYASIQLDIDATRIKAAALLAQTIDVTRVIGATNLARVVSGTETSDLALRELILPAYCYYTYSRLLTMFNGTLTDSGYVVSEDANRGLKQAKSDSDDNYSVAEVYMQLALDFLDDESEVDINIDRTVLTPKIRVFGGHETRGSN